MMPTDEAIRCMASGEPIKGGNVPLPTGPGGWWEWRDGRWRYADVTLRGGGPYAVPSEAGPCKRGIWRAAITPLSPDGSEDVAMAIGRSPKAVIVDLIAARLDAAKAVLSHFRSRPMSFVSQDTPPNPCDEAYRAALAYITAQLRSVE